MREIAFDLDVKDGWPPVAVEHLWTEEADGGLEVMSCPLFVSGLSVGDVITAEIDAQGRVQAWEYKSKSDRSTVWLLRISSAANAELLGALRNLGCNTAWSDQLGVATVDVQPSVSIAAFDREIDRLEASGWAVAYPSWRLEE